MVMKRARRSHKLALAALAGLLAAGLLLFSLRGKLRLLLAVPASTAFGGLAALLTLRRVELKRWWGVLLANACIAVMSALLLHLPMFDWMPIARVLQLNTAITMLLACLLTAVTASVRVPGFVLCTILVAFGFIDAAVNDFSSNIITFNDLRAIRTALNVAGSYRLSIGKYQVLTIVLYGVCVVLLLRVKEARPRLRRWPVRLVSLVCAGACLASAGLQLRGEVPHTYRRKGATLFGILGELTLEARSSIIASPPGYSDAAVARLSEENALPPAETDKPSVIDIYEHRPEGKPLFLFGVTMQNHGGYDDPDFASTVHVEGLQGQYPVVEQYLSLIRLSDEALKELTDYFRGRDEKVQILFFGDHQPNLINDRAMSLEIGLDDINKRYLVPFLLWNNYDQESRYVERTSLNFLMPRVLKEIGLTSAPYFNYLSRLNEQLPAISAIGYYYDGALHDLEDDEAEDLLKDYRILQYGNLFRTGLDERLFVGETAAP